MEYNVIEQRLIDNFNNVQSKINSLISTGKDLDIKQISDVERYVGMQESIVSSLRKLKEMK